MGVNLIAALWGFAEAILFFIVPDLWLSVAGRDDLRAGLRACLYALIGALVGGSIVYYWGAHDHSRALAAMDKVPAVSAEMISCVGSELNHRGPWALLFGLVSGTPYKLYAAQAAGAGVDFWLFLLVSIPGRLIRFVAVTLFCHYCVRLLRRLGLAENFLMALLFGWTLFYLLFFSLMPN